MRQWPAKIFRSGKRPVVVEKVSKRRARGTFGLDTAFPVDVDTIHTSVLGWLREVLPTALIVFSGAECSAEEPSGSFRKLGGVPGLPRLWVFMDDAFAFALEIRTQTTRLSGRQQDVQAKLRKLGFKVATVRGIEEARQALVSWGVKTNEAAR